jgi:hypothetical protein
MKTRDVARDGALELVTLAAVMVLRKLLGDDLTMVGTSRMPPTKGSG